MGLTKTQAAKLASLSKALADASYDMARKISAPLTSVGHKALKAKDRAQGKFDTYLQSLVK